MRRREFFTVVSGAAAWPLGIRAQGDDSQRIEVLMGFEEGDPVARPRMAAFEQVLHSQPSSKEYKFQIAYHWGAGDPDRARLLAKEIVNQKPHVIVTHTSPATFAVHRETRTIPIVFVQVTDPVAAGLAESLARPGGNATGFTNFDPSLGGKWLELLKEISPTTARVAILYNPDAAPFAPLYLRTFKTAAHQLSVDPIESPVRDDKEIESVMAAIKNQAHGGVVVVPDIFAAGHRKIIISLAAHHQVAAVYPFRYFAVDGGLIAYGIDPLDAFRRAAVYVDRVLKGEKPGDLPVQQPTTFELVINLKTAKVLGLSIPPTLLSRADEIIE